MSILLSNPPINMNTCKFAGEQKSTSDCAPPFASSFDAKQPTCEQLLPPCTINIVSNDEVNVLTFIFAEYELIKLYQTPLYTVKPHDII